jgi:thiol-disulfide isomerase/thioredoxin
MRRPDSERNLLAIALFALLAVGCRDESIRNVGCDAPIEVETGLRSAEGIRDRCAFDDACWERGLVEARALRDRFPHELAAHRAYIRSLYRGTFGEYGAAGQAVVEEYRQRLAQRPEDPGLLFLNALLTEDRVARRSLLRQASVQDENFSWPHLQLAIELGNRSGAEATAEARAESARFVAACPERLPEIQRLASSLDDEGLFERYRARFAEAFRPDRGRFSELAAYWQQSFQFAAPERHDGLRSELATALAATAALGWNEDRAWLRALEIGYRLTGDSVGAARVEELVLAGFPCEPQAISIRGRRFRAAQPRPGDGDADLARWRKAQVAVVDDLVAACPASGMARMWQLSALSELEDVPVETFVSAGLALAAARDIHAWPSNPAAAAKRFLERRVGLEKIAELLAQDRREMALERARALAFAESDEDLTDVRRDELLRSAGHMALRCELALDERRDPEAARLLEKIAAILDAVGGEVRDESQRQSVAAARADFWRLQALRAASLGDAPGELSAYGQAMAMAPPTPQMRAAATAAFVRVHGSGREFPGWLAGVERAREAAAVQQDARSHERAPEFRWRDLAGREWTLADLRGKAALLNFWATWCGPCVAEMPYVQQLADRLRDESRILVLGVSVDESPGLVKPFVDRLGCRYPVLLADAAVWTTWRFSAIPKNLIVGPGGEIVASDVPFDRDGKRWLESMATRLRAAAESISSPPR